MSKDVETTLVAIENSLKQSELQEKEVEKPSDLNIEVVETKVLNIDLREEIEQDSEGTN